ncbi:hypothetical protein [Acidisphaera rubrifaciens]|uniref:Uncharacterized protein n=1 Tax=Acidisphaera rubrifaciens HS-AP3 TaxID=1231350 RepID=A0A0D6P982_9PROT|nr:hypothetical protein [Acidisphaera rubrifaciens]GAN78212.1 hypothetical protein Asru_0686_05 [Acidisphaera rubrifaciens HS-AP3]
MTGRAGDVGTGGTGRGNAEHADTSGPTLDFVFVPDGGAPGGTAGHAATSGAARLRARFVPGGAAADGAVHGPSDATLHRNNAIAS